MGTREFCCLCYDNNGNTITDGSKWSVENTQGNGYRYIGSLIYNTGSGGEIIESAEFSQGKLILYKSVMKNLNMTNEMKLKKNYRH